MVLKMKVKSIFILCVLVLCGSISTGLYAQSSSSDQRLVSTWICENDGSTWVFNSDGTGGSRGGGSGVFQNQSFKYMAINGIIAISFGNSITDWGGGDYAISPDGRALVLKLSMFGLWFRKK
jgi:hypothetical protein